MKYFLISLLLSITLFSSDVKSQLFRTGDEVLLTDMKHLIAGKNLGVITNKTGVDRSGTHILDRLVENGFTVKKIFTPEHGFAADDNFSVSGISIPVISLYGKKISISQNDIEDIDVLIFDIQEMGVRFYTYTSTLFLTMKDAKSFGKTYIVCDRPSVANINYSSGFNLNNQFSSFVGKIPAVEIFGMTIGELSNYLNSEYVKNHEFYVAKMSGYSRNTLYENVMKGWVNPSPSITSLESARLYPVLCFLEGTNISEGRGTDNPFCVFGAPFLDCDNLITELGRYNLEGVTFEKTEFIPDQNKLPSYTAMKFTGKKCYGLKIIITDFNKFKPFETSVAVLLSLKKENEFKWTGGNFIDKLAGTDLLRKMIDEGYSFDEIISKSNEDSDKFRTIISSYLLY
ncbi:MAG: DUF1343 domain-containing protein [Ignavibacteria bacterium]|nr:DUF1343 domain-containing protein [Ignavibacteria bacterium]